MKVTFNRAKAHKFLSKFFCSVVMVIAIISFAGCDKDSEPEGVHYQVYTNCLINGIIIDYATKMPLNGVFIKISSSSSWITTRSTVTDNNGEYSVLVTDLQLTDLQKQRVVEGGVYEGTAYNLTIECSKDGYTSEKKNIGQVYGNNIYTTSLELKRK